MDINALHYFVAVVESGSISAAAKKLHISQPPLSRQIQLLESELGVLLMKRGSRNVVLTDAGNALYSRAKMILETFNVTLKEIDSFCTGQSGALYIGTVPSCSTILLSLISGEYRNKYPDIVFQLYEKHTYELLELLENNVIEVAILRSPYKKAECFSSTKVSDETFWAVGLKDYFTEMTTPFSFKQLADKPIIIYRYWETAVKDLFEHYQVQPRNLNIFDDARTSLMWAIAGMGISLLPSSIAFAIRDQALVYKQIKEPSLSSEIHATWKNVKHMSPTLQNFINMLETMFKNNR
jgi:DNA-binding transcriptional LysR family regulator